MDDFIKEMAQKLPPIGSTDGQGMKAPVIVVFADDYGIGKYLITEGERLPNNDFELFEAADEGYAMANADPRLKARATAVIASNDEDGVARWLLENA